MALSSGSASNSSSEATPTAVMTPAPGANGSGSGRGGFCGPAAKDFKWEHIFDRHHPDGDTAKQSRIKTLFENMTHA